MGKLSGVKSFVFGGLSFAVVGFLFMYLYSTYYVTYSSDYLMLGILFVIFTILAGFGSSLVKRFG